MATKSQTLCIRFSEADLLIITDALERQDRILRETIPGYVPTSTLSGFIRCLAVEAAKRTIPP